MKNDNKEYKMHTDKVAKIVGGIAMVLGAFLAICVENDSYREFALRGIGTALCLFGGWLTGLLTTKDEDDETDELD